MWSRTPSIIIFLAFTTHFFHSTKFYASIATGLRTSWSMNSYKPLSSSTISIPSLQAKKFELPSKAYSRFNPCNARCQSWSMYANSTFTSNSKTQNFKMSSGELILNQWYLPHRNFDSADSFFWIWVYFTKESKSAIFFWNNFIEILSKISAQKKKSCSDTM